MATTMRSQPSRHRGPIVAVIGPPASGKGTQCKRLAARFGPVHLSIGDILRDEVARGTELGARASVYMRRGDFVPDDMAVQLVCERVAQVEVRERGCLVDGFPRTSTQARLLRERLDLDRLVQLRVAEDVSVKRALGRRIDPETGAIYHLTFAPPPRDVLSRLVVRQSDASEEVVRTRLRRYAETIRDITSQFAGKLEVVDASPAQDLVFNTMCGRVAELFGGVAAPAAAEDDWDDEVAESAPEAAAVRVEVAPCRDLPRDATAAVPVAVTIDTPDLDWRTPTDICCVVDISGSMGQEATYEVDGKVTSDRLTFLDVVKHAVKTVMHMLQPGDRLALVSFDDEAQLVCGLEAMTSGGREQAVSALEALRPRGQTNLWGGIHAGLEALRSPKAPASGAGHRQRTLLVLTDGQPNVCPEAGHLAELRTYQESHPEFKFQMSTFGFGYELDSSLLLELATEGHGAYAFIPDAVILGTVFVNSVANVLSTHTQNATLHISAKGGATITGPLQGIDPSKVTEASWGSVAELGPLQLGQPRELVVPMQIPKEVGASYLEVVLVYAAPGNEREARVTAQGSAEQSDATAVRKAAVAELWAATVDTGRRAVMLQAAGQADAARRSMEELGARTDAALWASEGAARARLQALHADVSGRMLKALDGNERFNRWGKHYLRALVRSHELQQCMNFMDPGLQVYGGSAYKKRRSEGDAIFLSLPAPRPAQDETSIPCDLCGRAIPFAEYATHAEECANPRARGRGRPAVAPAPQRPRSPSPDMNVYYQGGGGGCFGANAVVTVLEDGADHQERQARVCEVRPGDRLKVVGGQGSARVRCVVQVERSQEKPLVALPGGLEISPGHPIRLAGVWRRPRELLSAGADAVPHEGLVYNFVLDDCHILNVNGMECVTLGHGLEGPVVGHAYFGTRRVVEDLSRCPDWADGVVRVGPRRAEPGVPGGRACSRGGSAALRCHHPGEGLLQPLTVH